MGLSRPCIHPGRYLLVTGRTLDDFELCGKTIPDDAVIVVCFGCERMLAISPEAARSMEEHRAAGDYFVGTVCSACALKHLPKVHALEASKQGIKTLGESEREKIFFDEFMRRIK